MLMRLSNFITCLLLVVICNLANGQSLIKIDLNSGQISQSEQGYVAGYKTIAIHLPQTDFQKIEFKINGIRFKFNCTAEQKTEDSTCCLYPNDINSGLILLHFNGKTLAAIGDRLPSYKPAILSGKDTITITGTATIKKPVIIPFETKEKPGETRAKEEIATYASGFCKDDNKDSAKLNGVPGLTFLCSEAVKNDSTCGVPVKSPFENMYLPPCFDPDGKAVSVKNHILYDMSVSDPLQKLFLFKIKRSTKRQNTGINGHFEYGAVKKRMSLKVADILAVSVIAHKDSSVIIDSNYINYFLDSAVAVQNAFSKAPGQSKKDTAAKILGLDHTKKDATYYLNAATTLRSDLVYFNNFYKDLNFIQEKYNAALACLQVNIAQEFSLDNIPRTGKELAAAIEGKIGLQLPKVYWAFACKILNQLAAEYDIAVNRRSNYRIYTQVLQVPNADEIKVGMKTGKATNYLYRHDFIIKGGLKLDFSSGVFLTGLNDIDYVLRSVRFRFKDSSAAPAARDTTGNLIAVNEDKLNFNTGFLVHVYTRSGMFTNLGLVTGVTFNNSDFMWMLGGSIMFRMGSGRLSLVGGWAFGKQKALDANHQQYLYDATQFPTNQEYIGNDINNRLPRFFPETNITTYEKRETSWFAGITYNFASIKL